MTIQCGPMKNEAPQGTPLYPLPVAMGEGGFAHTDPERSEANPLPFRSGFG